MRATLCIQTRIGQPQPFDGPPAQEMFLDNLLHIPHVNEAIPDRIRIHHNNRSMLALVQASKLIGPDFTLQASLLDGILEGRFELFASPIGAARARSALFPFVDANKDMMLELRHCRYSYTRRFSLIPCAGHTGF
jgi:hypothetical protein